MPINYTGYFNNLRPLFLSVIMLFSVPLGSACASPYAEPVSGADRQKILERRIDKYEDVAFFESVADDGSIFGYDTDQDGVRDDVEHYIIARYVTEPELRYFFYERARLSAKNLADRLDLAALQKTQVEYSNVIECINNLLPGDRFGKEAREFREFFFNSNSRKSAQREHSNTLGGTVGLVDNHRLTLEECKAKVPYYENR